MKYYIGSSLLFVIAFTSILIVLPVALLSVSNANEQVESDVTHYARGSYDILVRAEGNKHPLEDELGIVPENYIGFGNGGISIEQWQTIKEHSDIEVAAPVVSLGYFTGLNSNVGLEMVDSSSSYNVEYYTTDGLNNYPIGDFLECIHLEHSGDASQIFMTEYLINDESLLNYCFNAVQFQLPTTYQLLVAIDPIEEEKLTGVSYPLDGSGEGAYHISQLGGDRDRVIPVLEISSSEPSLIGQFEVHELPIDAEKTKELREEAGLEPEGSQQGPIDFYQIYDSDEYLKIYNHIKEINPMNSYDIAVDFSNYLRGFYQETFLVNVDGEVEFSQLDGNYVSTLDLRKSSLYYTAGYPEYEEKGGNFFIPKLGEMDGVPIYRDVNENGFDIGELTEFNEEELFILDPIEQVTVEAGSLELSSSPLGIYQFAPVYHIDEETGDKTLMTPTVTPGSFVSSPASGVTHIDYVEILKGNEPSIDAIRVRVAGIDTYDEAAKEKIDEITGWINELGLETTIVAGASPQILTLEVEDVGLVEEAWTTLGAAGDILNFWNVLALTFSVLFFIVTILYAFNRFSFWQVSRREDFKLYEQLGWSKRHIYRLNIFEILSLLIISVGLSLLGIYILQQFLNIEGIFNWLLISIGIVVIFVILLSYFKLYLFSSKDDGVKKRRRNQLTRKVKSYILKNILFFKSLITPSFIQLMIASFLLTIVFMMINKTADETTVTLLGQHINLETEQWQLILIAATVVLTFITMIETIISLVRERVYEIRTLKTIGWDYKDIFLLYVKENIAWCFLAIFIGALLTIGTYSVIYTIHLSEVVTTICVSFILLVIVLIIIVVTLNQLIRRI